MPPCSTLSIIRYGSRVKWSNPGKGVAPSPTPRCSSYWKRRLQVTLDYGRQFPFTYYHYYTSYELFASVLTRDFASFPSCSKSSPLFKTLLIVLIFLYYMAHCEFFASALAEGTSLEFEWQQVSSGLKDSFQNSSRS